VDAPNRRAPRKTPAERGPVGWWGYETMVTLGLSDAQIADRAGVGAATIRKWMGSPKGSIAAAPRQAIYRYFREVSEEKRIPINEPPDGFMSSVSTSGNGSTLTPEVGALIEALAAQAAAINAQTAAMTELVAELRALRGSEPEPPIVGRARAAVAAVDSAAGQARNTPPLRRRGRDRRGAGGSQRSRETEAS